jgi:hypothetical protein
VERSVFGREEHDGARGQSVTPGASGFLIIGFERAGHGVVQDEAHVGPVNPHAKSVGGDDERQVARHECVLRFGASRGVERAVIVARVEAAHRADELGHVLGVAPRAGVNDPRALGLRYKIAHEAELRLRVGRRENFEGQVRAVESRHQAFGVRQAEQAEEVVLHTRGGGGRQRERDGRAEFAAGLGDVEVVRSEIVAPLRHAMGFVHHQEAEGDAGEGLAKGAAAEALRRDEDDFVLAVREGAEAASLLG